MPTLQEKYKKEVVPAMRTKFGYKNIMAVPKITKVVVNVGVGKLHDSKEREEVQRYLALITGQKSSSRPAKKAIAAFKTRKGLVIGYRVTLRDKRMYDFLSRLVNVALPRTRDFQGIDPGSFDPAGNLTIGVKEHMVFPEIIGEDYRFLFGLEVTVVTTAKKKEEGIELLKLIGFPIRS
ncbi:MAG: 50S ribosomal protein L5 [Candidatus Sungiibacteriota bacterium]|uniref:Large ribosomal subunit protein uL5 n=1 Tax=Candidatus Sungiibacteriota bacterium TaxID=2750080 RepID=A0A7T5UPN3_9BACT|nr:MAG: 50S ribosomal protein L5 [Candidatus Sungbacteria bacterium]